MTKDECKRVVELMRDSLWCDRQLRWWRGLPSPRKKTIYEGWWKALRTADYGDALQAVEQLTLEVSPFDKRWEYSGQVLRENARRIRVAKDRQLESRELIAQSRPPEDVIKYVGGGGIVRRVAAQINAELGEVVPMRDADDHKRYADSIRRRMDRARELAQEYLRDEMQSRSTS